jgi:hypothetical protein
MTTSWARDRRLNQALLASLTLHLGLALLIPAAVVMSGDNSAIETLSFVRVARVQIVHPEAERHAPAVAPVAAPVTHIVHHSATPSLHRTARTPTANTTDRSTAPTVGSIARGDSAGTQPGSSTAPVAAAQVAAPTETPRERVGGYMPLGAEDPVPVLDPSVRTALAALNVHVKLVITVDENGHTKHVTFDPPLDAQTQSRILALLESAQWDPATCGAGVPCEAPATITL